MTRVVVAYRGEGGRTYGHGPFGSRTAAAHFAAEHIAGERMAGRRVMGLLVSLEDRPVEPGHVPLGVNADGEGPVSDEEATRFVCLECGCPGIVDPSVHRQRLAEMQATLVEASSEPERR